MNRINIIRFAVTLFCYLTSLNCLAQTANWPQFRGPQASGVAEGKNLPDEWGPDKNILWKTEVPGKGHSSPIIWGNRIFLTSDIEGDIIPGQKAIYHERNKQPWVHPDALSGNKKHTLKVICLDRDSGKILWERIAHEGAVLDDRHKKNTYASGTPVTDGKYVYAFFEAEGLFCYDFTGKLIWKTSLGQIAKMGMGPGTSPVLHENLLYLQCDVEDGGAGGFLAAIDKRTGKEVWRVKREHRKTHATPLIVQTGQRTELITNGWETIVSYDAKTGQELWQCAGVKAWGIPSPVAGHGMVFLAAGYPSKRAIGVKLGGAGKLDGTPNVVWSYTKGTAYVTSPILYGDYLYLVSEKGILTCLDAKTGEIKYEGGRVPTPATFFASAVAFDGKLFLTSEDGETFVIKAGPVHEVIRTNNVGEPVMASPAIANGKVFIRGDKHLYCIGAGEKGSGKLSGGQ